MRYLKIPLILLAVLSLIAFSGCGDDDDTEETTSSSTTESAETTTTDSSTETTEPASGDYSGDLQSILTEFGTSFQTTGLELQSATDQDSVAAGLDELESQLETTIGELESLDPPEEAQEGQDQLISAFEGLETSLGDTSDAVDSGDEEDALSAVGDFATAGAEFQTDFSEALTTLQASGAISEAPAGVGG